VQSAPAGRAITVHKRAMNAVPPMIQIADLLLEQRSTEPGNWIRDHGHGSAS
jgi:hypothetical protein